MDGSLAGRSLPKPVQHLVTIGGQNAKALYAGAAPGLVAGLLQVNAVVPAGVASGDQPIVVTVGTVASQTGVTVAVK